MKRKVGDQCVLDIDCFDAVVNSVCTSGECACKQGYVHVPEHGSCNPRKCSL